MKNMLQLSVLTNIAFMSPSYTSSLHSRLLSLSLELSETSKHADL